ncbi:MAG: U32 family peptidase, partial [Clostridiales bacterium]|nr:U32 family peptidase [Clostridiales bacterium]
MTAVADTPSHGSKMAAQKPFSAQPFSRIELLAPARDAAMGIAAIDCGADAVYIGPPRFGARAAAGNSLKDIKRLCTHAHACWARVYATVNTILRDDELPMAVALMHELYDCGVDAFIIQDAGLLECDLPPAPLIASTQMHNNTPAKVAFLEHVGFSRVILARELSLDDIKRIRAHTSIELETFVHGALCVSYSGRCFMSFALGGRSGNRGECAQPCRRVYSLVDSTGAVLARGRHLLSLKDMNRAAHLGDLIDAGVTSFKIEGRLKDIEYVRNTVAFYRIELDRIIAERGLAKASSGSCRFDFTPDPLRTFNRGFTPYFLSGRGDEGAVDTPKSLGEPVGAIIATRKDHYVVNATAELHRGDGICFFDADNVLQGTLVNDVRNDSVFPDKLIPVAGKTKLWRNSDVEFLKTLRNSRSMRMIAVRFRLVDDEKGFVIEVRDEDGNTASLALQAAKAGAEKPDKARATIKSQLSKCGGSGFVCDGVAIATKDPCFIPVSVLNELRRGALDALR